MLRVSFGLVLSLLAFALPASAQPVKPAGHYMFAWAGDTAGKGYDFMAVIDADPGSPGYGQVVASAATDQPTRQVHHTEYVMPESGMLFANDHKAGRTFVFDLKDPLTPKVSASFEDLAGYAHPHSFARLPNGHVLASFQMTGGHDMAGMDMSGHGSHGGLVEIDEQGHAVRSASTADPAYPDAMLAAYSLVVLPEIDRVVVTNSGMRELDVNGHSFQVFRLSDLKLLKTQYLDTGGTRYGDINPEEPRRGPDGSVYVQTLACGVERISDIGSDAPKSKLVHVFPGSMCGVPTIVGHYLVQSVPTVHSLIALDLTDPAKPAEVSRLDMGEGFWPHWTGWDAKTGRLVVTGYDVNRLYMVKLDQTTGALSLDTAFHDADGKPGFSFEGRAWPHGWTGTANPHGVVFSR
jgi:hypothetical protein